MTAFGKWLREARIARRLSYRDLAGMTGYSHSYLHKLETFGKRPTEDVICRIAAALERSPQEALLVSGYAGTGEEVTPEALEVDGMFRRMPPRMRRFVVDTIRNLEDVTTGVA